MPSPSSPRGHGLRIATTHVLFCAGTRKPRAPRSFWNLGEFAQTRDFEQFGISLKTHFQQAQHARKPHNGREVHQTPHASSRTSLVHEAFEDDPRSASRVVVIWPNSGQIWTYAGQCWSGFIGFGPILVDTEATLDRARSILQIPGKHRTIASHSGRRRDRFGRTRAKLGPNLVAVGPMLWLGLLRSVSGLEGPRTTRA